MRSRIFRYIEARDTNRACIACDLHGLIEHDRRLLGAAVAFRLEADCVDEAVDDWLPNHGRNEFAEPVVGVEIDRLESNAPRVR